MSSQSGVVPVTGDRHLLALKGWLSLWLDLSLGRSLVVPTLRLVDQQLVSTREWSAGPRAFDCPKAIV